MSLSLDLEKHLVFYGAYHHNPVNVAIHMVGVPLIMFSAFCLATNTPSLLPFVPSWAQVPYLEPNLGTLAAFVWGGLYVLLEPVAGTALAILCVAGTAACNAVRVQSPDATNRVALVVQIASWVLQFLGHGLFEGRSPALLDNLFQAIFLAPLFVWLEILFLLGYRQELRARVNRAVEAELAKLKSAKKKQ